MSDIVAWLWQNKKRTEQRIVMPGQIITVSDDWQVVGPLVLAEKPKVKAQAAQCWRCEDPDYPTACDKSACEMKPEDHDYKEQK